jgi:hypothetical protein
MSPNHRGVELGKLTKNGRPFGQVFNKGFYEHFPDELLPCTLLHELGHLDEPA